MFAGGELVRRERMSYVHVRHKHPNGRLTTKQCNLPSSLRAIRAAWLLLNRSPIDYLSHVVTRFAWRAPRRAAASRQQGLTTLGNRLSRDFSFRVHLTRRLRTLRARLRTRRARRALVRVSFRASWVLRRPKPNPNPSL